jgi:hypothetical protein
MKTLDAEAIMARATPKAHQHAHVVDTPLVQAV